MLVPFEQPHPVPIRPGECSGGGGGRAACQETWLVD